MSATSEKLSPQTSEASNNVTGSPALEAGASPCASPIGTTIDLFGQHLSPASHLALPGKERVAQTIATSGQHTSGSFKNSALSISLANKLKRRLNLDGSMEYRLTWSKKATPSGRLYYLLRASARHTQDTEYSGWPTPRSEDSQSSGERISRGVADTLTAVSRLAGWPSPKATNVTGASETETRQGGADLQTVAQLSGWCSPTAMDGNRG